MRKRLKRLPKWCLDRKHHVDRLDPYSTWTDRSKPRPNEDKDPRTAFDALDPDKPKGMD